MVRVKYFMGAAFAVLLLCPGNTGGDDPAFLGPAGMAYAPGQGRVYIAEYHGKRIDVMDLNSQALVRSLPLKGRPNGVFVTRDQKNLLVSQGMDRGRLLVYDLKRSKKKEDLLVGHSPTAIAESQHHIILCHRFPGEISFLDKERFVITKRVKVGREPMAMVVVPRKNRLYVAHHLPEMAATAGHVAAKISVIDLNSLAVTDTLLLPNGSSGVKDICTDPRGQYLLVTHILARYNLPPTQLERGWMNTNALSIIDMAEIPAMRTILLDDIDHGAANPWDIEFSADGKKLFVSHAGTHEISIIDWEKVKDVLTGDGKGPADHPYSENLGFLYPYRKRLPLNGNGPRTLLTVRGTLFVANYYTDNLSLIRLEDLGEENIRLGNSDLPDHLLGEMYFNDASLCFQSWQSCVSCHPDARVDGLNWDLLNDGIGNPKNVKSLLLSHQTPPAMSLAVRSDAKVAVRAGFKHIQFADVPEAYSALVDTYLEGLTPVSSPHKPPPDNLYAGERLFQSLQCHTCHPAPLYTDLHAYPVGDDPTLRWDTPTLVELWRTGPYWHDGRYADLKEVFETKRHGLQKELSADDLRALTDYLLTL